MSIKYPTVLMITENPTLRISIKNHLSDRFFVLDASSREKALEVIRYAALDCILLDSAFEACSPFALSLEMRQNLQRSLTPIFLITNRLKESYREEAFESGITDFLRDPFSFEEFDARFQISQKAAALRQKTTEAQSSLEQKKKKDFL